MDTPAAAQSRVDGRSLRWQAHKAKRRIEMLDAAIAVIEEEGLQVTVRQVSDRLGVPRPVVYRHFSGKDDLDEQIRGRIIEMLMAELDPALHPGGTVGSAVRQAIGTYLGWVEKHPRLHHFLGTGSHREHRPGSQVVAVARSAIGTQLAGLLAAALRTVDQDVALARPMAFGIIGLVDGVVNSWRSDPGSSVTAAQIEALLVESVLVLIEGNARALGVLINQDIPVATLLDDGPPGSPERTSGDPAASCSTRM